MKQVLLILIGIWIGVLFASRGCFNKSKIEQLSEMNRVAKDSISVLVNENGELETRIESFQATELEYILELETNNETINLLKKKVKEFDNPKTVIVHETETVYQDTGSVIVRYLELTEDQIASIEDSIRAQYTLGEKWAFVRYPITATTHDDWVRGTAIVYKDKSIWNLKIDDTRTYAIEEKGGFLGLNGNRYEVVAQTDNPYVKSNELRSIVESKKRRKIDIGAYVGMDHNLKPSFGVGLMYPLIKI